MNKYYWDCVEYKTVDDVVTKNTLSFDKIDDVVKYIRTPFKCNTIKEIKKVLKDQPLLSYWNRYKATIITRHLKQDRDDNFTSLKQEDENNI